jgi:predicted dehydrogenase
MEGGCGRLKAGIIGNWGHHVCVLSEIDTMPKLSIVGMAPGYEGENLSSLTPRYGDTAIRYDDHRRMLAEQALDVVIISTRLDRIADLALDAARAGCHAICEKPLAIEHGALLRLWKAVAKSGSQCIAMLHNRNQPVLAAARQAVASGRIGDVKLINVRKSYKCPNEDAGWLGRRCTYGGTIPWIGIHALDFIEAVTGGSFSSVSAMHANVAHDRQPEREDICTMNLRLDSGAMATASIDYLRPASAGSHGDDWLRIVGTAGSIEAAMARQRMLILDADGTHEVTAFGAQAPYYPPLIRAFVDAGRAGPAAETRRAFALTHVALCARGAADNGTIADSLGGPWTEAG